MLQLLGISTTTNSLVLQLMRESFAIGINGTTNINTINFKILKQWDWWKVPVKEKVVTFPFLKVVWINVYHPFSMVLSLHLIMLAQIDFIIVGISIWFTYRPDQSYSGDPAGLWVVLSFKCRYSVNLRKRLVLIVSLNPWFPITKIYTD